MGLLSIGVLNVNNIRDMESDKGVRHTVPIRIGERGAKWYQTILVTLGTVCFLVYLPAPFLTMFWFLFAIPVVGMGIHIAIVWRSKGKALDPALPLLVFSTFFIAIIYSIIMYGIA